MNNTPLEQHDAGPEDWLVGGGEMGKLIRSMDWTATPLGPIETWPQSLRTIVSLCLASNFPISLAWGPRHVQIYNDGYWPICGGKHPYSMGQDFSECWASAWPAIGAAFARARAGETSYIENQRMFLDRNGYLEETFFTFSFSPIRDETGGVGGLFHPVTETTSKMLSERRTRALRDLAARSGKAQTIEEAFTLAAQTLSDSELDLPFILFYLLDAQGKEARLIANPGLLPATVASPTVVDLAAPQQPAWPLAEVMRSGQVQYVDDLETRFDPLSCGPYSESPQVALVVPITPPGCERPIGILVAGVSSRLVLNEAYHAFYDLLAAGVTTAVANARAYEEERKRAEALAEIDREEALHWLRDAPADSAVIPPSAQADNHATAAAPGRPQPRILWADDNADLRAYVTGLLAPYYHVEAVADGEMALAAARERKPDLVLSDVMMPRLDGFGLLRELRADARTRDIPVILLSARAGEESAVEGLEAGADDYLVKPFSARELLARVRTHLELARVRRKWAQELEQANKELEAFSYSVSHDLRAPLRAIDGFSEALLSDYADRLDDEGRHYLQRVRAGAQRMALLINDLLSLSRITRVPLRKESISLTELARAVVAARPWKEPSRKVAIEIATGLSAHGDARLITILLENLLENAWKFTSKRPEAQIVFGQERKEDETIFYVRDNGAGFDMAYADKLFAPFQRLHLASEFEGTGIGLATVRRIITRHGGHVWAEAAVDKGATFFFTLGDTL